MGSHRLHLVPVDASGSDFEPRLPHLRNGDGIPSVMDMRGCGTFGNASEPSPACRSVPGSSRGPRTRQPGRHPGGAPQAPVDASPGWPAPGGRAIRSPQGAPRAHCKSVRLPGRGPRRPRGGVSRAEPLLALGPGQAQGRLLVGFLFPHNKNTISSTGPRLETRFFSSPAQSSSRRAPGLEVSTPGFSNLIAEATGSG